jgi:hypothetical protein
MENALKDAALPSAVSAALDALKTAHATLLHGRTIPATATEQ